MGSFQRRFIWNGPLGGTVPKAVQKAKAGGEHMFAICAYGDSPYLESCLRSIEGQSVASQAILCTSTPSPYLEEAARRHHIPCYVRDGESRIGDDWNFAYHMADARLVTIAHQDDLYQRDYVKTLLTCYGKYPDMTLFTGDYLVVKNGSIQKTPRSEWIKRILRLPLRLRFFAHLGWVKKSALMLGNPICCPSCTYHKAALGGPLFDPSYQFALDWDALLRLAGRPGRFVCVERPVMYYRIHKEATTRKCILDQRRCFEEAKIFQRIWPGPVARALMHFYKKAYEAYDK